MFNPLLTGITEYGRGIRDQLPNVPMLRETERTLRVVAALADAAVRPVQAGPFYAPPAETETARHWRKRAAGLDGPTALNEVESKSLLRGYGIPLPPERMVMTAAEAEQAAREIGYPVVLKGIAAALPHKSDAGLVILSLSNAAAVREAAATLSARAAALAARLDGILVAKQISGGTETVLGVQRDVEMGPVVMFGLGGIWVELFKDVSFAPATLDRQQALTMVRKTRAGRLLEGFRGSKPGDYDDLCEALVNLGRLVCDLGDVIESVDINPFLVCEQGRGAFALDGLVVLRPPTERDREQRR
jgi:succinyl-CoA synthetase beta subunit